MIRKTLTILSLIGLLLSVGLWGVSYLNFMCHLDQQRLIFLALCRGELVVCHRAKRPLWPQKWIKERRAAYNSFREERILDIRAPLDLSGFTFQQKRWEFCGYKGMETSWWPEITNYANSSMDLYLPLWMPSLVFASFTYLGFRPFYRRRKRKKLGLCLKCGYDLRASSERCPECGQEFVGVTRGDIEE